MLSSAFHGNVDEMAKVFPNIRGLVGAFNLTGDSAKKNAEIFDEMSGKTNMVQVGFQRLQQTSAQKLRRALAEMQAAAIKLGAVLLPIAGAIADKLSTLIGWFGKLPAPMREVAMWGIGIAAALGPVIWIVGTLAKGFGPLMTGMVGIIGFAQAVTATMTALDVGFIAATSSVLGFDIALLAIPIAVALLIAGLVILYLKVKAFRDAVNSVVDFIDKHWKILALVPMVGAIAILIHIAKHFGDVKAAARDVFGWLRTAAGNVAGWFSQAFSDVKGVIVDALNFMIDRINDVIRGLNVLPGVDIGELAHIGEFHKVPSRIGKAINQSKGPLDFGNPLHFHGHKPGKKAMGGPVLPGGQAIVGERGPELVQFPFGAQVRSAKETRKLLEQGGNWPAITIPVYLDGKKIAESTVRAGESAKARR
jgi:hypothetical protein